MNKRYFSSLSFLLVVGVVAFSGSKLGAMQESKISSEQKITFSQQMNLWHCNSSNCPFNLRNNDEIRSKISSPNVFFETVNPEKKDLTPADFLNRVEDVLKQENITNTLQTGALLNYIHEEILAEKNQKEVSSKSSSRSSSPQKKLHKKDKKSRSRSRSKSRSRSLSRSKYEDEEKEQNDSSSESLHQEQEQKEESEEQQQQQQQQQESEDVEIITCALCCEGFEEGEEVLHYDDKCNHPFHLFCLNQLYQREDAAQCPNCLIEQENADN